MSTIFIGWFALQTLGAVAFVVLAKKTSVLVDEDERPIQAPRGMPDEHIQIVRHIEAAS